VHAKSTEWVLFAGGGRLAQTLPFRSAIIARPLATAKVTGLVRVGYFFDDKLEQWNPVRERMGEK